MALIEQTGAKAQAICFAYDRAARLLSKDYCCVGPVQVTHSYDEPRAGFFNKGQRTSATGFGLARAFDHDLRGRLAEEIWQVYGGAVRSSAYAYDSGDWLIARQFPDGDVVGTTGAPWTYDHAGRLATVPGFVAATSWTASDQIAAITYENGVVTPTATIRPASGSPGWTPRPAPPCCMA